MNKVILMGRLTRDPEIRYGAQSGNAVARFSIAVNRRFKREGQPDADFFNCTAFGRNAEFVEKYLHKGIKIILDGEVQNDNYTNREGNMVYGTQIIVNQLEFAESKAASNQYQGGGGYGDNFGGGGFGGGYSQPAPGGAAPAPSMDAGDGFMNIPDSLEEELPFS